jgi:Zn-dependent alcohol dehydrogenase
MASGASALVIGLGGVGLNTLQAIRHVGGTPAMVIDPSPAKRSTAMKFGATAASDIDQAAARAMVQAATAGRGAEYVFVTAGAPGAFQQGLSLLAPTGTLVIVGMPANGVEASISPGNIAAAGQKILGSKMGSTVIARDVPPLVEAYREGRLKLDELVSGRYPLAQINAAIEDVKSGNAIRNVIIFEPAATVSNGQGGIAP